MDSFKAFTVEYDGEIDAAEADVEQAHDHSIESQISFSHSYYLTKLAFLYLNIKVEKEIKQSRG